MTASQRALASALAVAGWLGTGLAQPIISQSPPDVLLSTQFRIPLSYEAALERLDGYYDEQIGRKSAAAFPRIAPYRHFELWHDMWVTFDPADGGTMVTVKRPSDGSGGRLLVKSWMLNLAGRLDSPLPIRFKEEPPLHSAEGDLYASSKDLARLFRSDASMKTLPTWEHGGLVVSASPMISVILTPPGLHGVRRLAVAAETAVVARQLLNRIQQGVLKPGIYAAYSEDVEIKEEVENTANGKVDNAGATASQALYIPVMDRKLVEEKLRADPEMHKRMLLAQGHYDIRFRLDKPWRKIVVAWTEFSGYSRASGTHEGEHPLGQSTITAPRMTTQPGAYLVARTKLETLKPGAYRVSLEGEGSAGELLKIDERIFWFDGKNFEEL